LNYNRTREITIQFKNLHANDFADTLALYDLNESTVGRSNLITTLLEQGKSIPAGEITIYINGRKFTSPNYLVADGTLIENLKEHKIKMRMKVYYDYFGKTTIGNYEFVTFSTPREGGFSFGDAAGDAQRWVIYAFNTYAPLIIFIAILFAGVMFLYSVGKKREKAG